MEKKKTVFDAGNMHHQMLAGIMTMFVDDFGSTPRELLELMESAKRETWHALQEIAKEKRLSDEV
ncbi:hypothetical protein T458_05155 [Brevibacillus panacihumi W25]|uniref:Uncharacterized protein n=1 Tax=Brevibacillus panacihumi W25 TaxID=1408254 RepID=V6ME36_9BACL|nr:hypothetical protein [Brevibacillus panacihumi]EST56789.1 hypothetical protein T458_05155 [Brevibacillus panacihumi W25]